MYNAITRNDTLTALSVGRAGALATVARRAFLLVGLNTALLNAIFPEAAAANLALARCCAGQIAYRICMAPASRPAHSHRHQSIGQASTMLISSLYSCNQKLGAAAMRLRVRWSSVELLLPSTRLRPSRYVP
jgi:hypothetical protein